jgi:hypothetical protein
MNYLVLFFAVLIGSVHLAHRRMVRKIYEADGRSLSTLSLARIIRREYAARYGMDYLYRYSQIVPLLAFILILVASVFAFRK